MTTDVERLVTEAHRAQLTNLELIHRLEDDTRTLEEVLALKRTALDRARESQGNFAAMTRDVMELFRFVTEHREQFGPVTPTGLQVQD